MGKKIISALSMMRGGALRSGVRACTFWRCHCTCSVHLLPCCMCSNINDVERYWWHHVEVTAPPAQGQLGLSISFFLERKGLPPVRPGSNGHRVDMVRKLEGALSKILGQKSYVPLLKKLDKHLSEGRSLQTFKAGLEGGSKTEWNHALEVISYVWTGGGADDKTLSTMFLNKGETKEQFVHFAIRGRYNVPQHAPDAKVPRHMTDAEDLDLPPLPTDDELQRKVDGELDEARAEAHRGVMADAEQNLRMKLNTDSKKKRTRTRKKQRGSNRNVDEQQANVGEEEEEMVEEVIEEDDVCIS